MPGIFPKNVEVSVILPAYNAAFCVENSVSSVQRFLTSCSRSFEIIVVDDGSADRTSEILSALSIPELRVLRNDRNAGKGSAVARAMLVASGQCRIFTDIDLPYDLRAIPLAMELINRRDYHLVIGDRTLPGSNYFDDVSRLRNAASKIFSTFIRLAITGEVPDTQCGFKAFRGDVAEELFSQLRLKGFGFDVELLYVALKYNLEIRRIPVRYTSSSSTTVNPWTDGVMMLSSIIPLPLYWRMGRYKSEKLEKLGMVRYWP
ncbi:MAG: glycosyltransferase [Acidobacteria bacterium]|nr:glycosyltransferase [Acidobacteriota bacterium]